MIKNSLTPKITIITPTYNHEQYIGECIESVLNQSYENWEMIIVNDASDDDTFKIISNYRDSRIRVVNHVTRYGPEKLFKTHNEALNRSNGELITILEGDDCWPEYRLELQVKDFDDPEVVLSHGKVALYRDNKKYRTKYSWPSNIIFNEPLGSALKAFILGYNFLGAQSVMVRKDILIKIGGFKQVAALYLVDFPTYFEVSLYGKFSFIPEVLGYWRQHSMSITSLHQEKLWLGYIEYINVFLETNKDKLSNLKVDLTEYVNSYGYNAFFSLCKIYALNNEKTQARKIYKELIARKKIISGLKEKCKLLALYLCLYVPVIYKVGKLFYDKVTLEKI